MIRCPYCNFETEYPAEPGKVYECLGECYTTYMLLPDGCDNERSRLRLIEIFFLDPEFNIQAGPAELDQCEFRAIPAREAGATILFARERRPSEGEIDSLKAAVAAPDTIPEALDRLRASLDRFERYFNNGAGLDRLANQARVLERQAIALHSVIKQQHP